MPIRIQIFSDYVCPFCLLGKKALEEASQGYDVELEWLPFELRPYPEPTLRPEDPYLPKVWNSSVYPMAQELGVPIHLPSVSPQPYTHLAFEGYQYAREQGRAQKYNDRMLRAFFQEDLDIGNVEVLVRLAGELGLDQDEFRAALESRRYETQHREALRYARQLGVNSLPTFIIGNEIRVGVQPATTLRAVIERAAQANG